MAQQGVTRCTRVLSSLVLTVLTALGARAQGTAGVSTGQGLAMGATDPYWHYIIGPVDYTAPGALLALGGPAVVDTLYDLGGRPEHCMARGFLEYPWALRSRHPGLNVNNGWLHPPRPVWDATPLGPTTLRTFIDLTHRTLATTQLAGTVWADGQLVAIYVNGQALATVETNTVASEYLDWNIGPKQFKAQEPQPSGAAKSQGGIHLHYRAGGWTGGRGERGGFCAESFRHGSLVMSPRRFPGRLSRD